MAKSRHTKLPNFTYAIRKLLLSSFVLITFIVYGLQERAAINSTPQEATATPSKVSQAATQSQSDAMASAASSSRQTSNVSTSSSQPASNAPAASSQQQAASVPAAPAQPTTAPKGQYVDGQYTGQVVDAYYGLVQVQATVQGGKISDVQFLKYPTDRRTSQWINSQATPWLRTEALQAQSSRVNIISGATLTSEGFIMSLQSALAQAVS